MGLSTGSRGSDQRCIKKILEVGYKGGVRLDLGDKGFSRGKVP